MYNQNTATNLIVTDCAVISASEVDRMLQHIMEFTMEEKIEEALALTAVLLKKLRVVRQAINEQPLTRYAHHIETLTELEDTVRNVFLELFEAMSSLRGTTHERRQGD
jgi:hypothetical protein